MDKATFEHELSRGRICQELEQDRAEYWIGYQRGLRRAYHGQSFGTMEEHTLWTASADSDDLLRQQRGEGYADGLAGAD